MKKLVVENFGRFRETFVKMLRFEDYEEEGLLELSQLQEAINSANEELEPGVLDYMLYYVLVRSESPELMQYNLLIELLDNLIGQQSRAASAQRKNRPESSSPEKLKMRNPQKAAQSSGQNKAVAKKAEEEDEDNYSDEEIANDSDDGDDGTKGLMKVQQKEFDEEEDEKYLDEFEKVQQQAKKSEQMDEEDDEYANDDQFEESPRPKVGS